MEPSTDDTAFRTFPPNTSILSGRSTVTDLDELDMTDLTSIEEALALIDKGLGGLTERQLVSASEVTDLLLDVRSLLSDA